MNNFVNNSFFMFCNKRHVIQRWQNGAFSPWRHSEIKIEFKEVWMSEQTVSWRTKQISSVCRELKQELHDILILFLIAVVLPATTESPTRKNPASSFITCHSLYTVSIFVFFLCFKLSRVEVDYICNQNSVVIVCRTIKKMSGFYVWFLFK